MQTRLITLEIELAGSLKDLQQAIASALTSHGEPLRWAITRVNQQQASIEAVVLTDD
ncbi:MAG: hypothetical protein HC886_10010 [Leptolyngbyaceae cyanobacterium SM1_1_3]|nr:hypothetical protein [Leptolyngbyaceae cyanobacterium SM1_1_3]NJN04423.1 hypothetical protein [Leptolyngbyaceae cyanobacterium RM1_1_2]NJO11659.1 hypothetical protein [Leptolyngbyaceae cyanobacterium SL_1_1]